VERDSGRPTQRRDVRDRLDCPYFVVGPHDSAQGHIAARQGIFDRVNPHSPKRINWKPASFCTLLVDKPLHWIEHCVVLDGGQKNAPRTGGAMTRPVQTFSSEVVGFRSTGGEDHGTRTNLERTRDLLAGLLDETTGMTPR
jgi:hypothetical protein